MITLCAEFRFRASLRLIDARLTFGQRFGMENKTHVRHLRLYSKSSPESRSGGPGIVTESLAYVPVPPVREN
jgi:hypothetical protein